MRERLINAGILAGAMLIAIAIAEIGIRKFGRVQMQPTMYALDSLTVYRLKPNVRGRAVHPGVKEFTWTTNSQQLRAGRDFPVAKPQGTKRVITIGDSFTFGNGVNDDETYPAQVERLLQNGCPEPVEIINFGVGGFGASQELELLERYALQFEPDVVTYGFMTNDIADNVQYPIHNLVGDSVVPRPVPERPQMIALKRITDRIPGYSWLITHSAFVNGLRQVYFVIRRRQLAGAADLDAHRDAILGKEHEAPPAAWNLQRALLRRMQRDVESRGGKFFVIIMLGERSAEHYYRGQPNVALGQSRMNQLCGEIPLRCVDVGAWMVANAPNADLKKLYIQGDGHFTAAGQTLAARAVEPVFRELLGCQPTL